MRKFTVRYETKSWYEIEVEANYPEDAVAKVKNAGAEELAILTADKRLENENLTPTDVQTPYA